MLRLLSTTTMSKRPRSGSVASSTVPTHKKSRLVSTPSFNPNKVATAENAAAVVSDPPLPILLTAVQNAIKAPKTGQSIVYWMRMADLRSSYYSGKLNIAHVIDCYSQSKITAHSLRHPRRH